MQSPPGNNSTHPSPVDHATTETVTGSPILGSGIPPLPVLDAHHRRINTHVAQEPVVIVFIEQQGPLEPPQKKSLKRRGLPFTKKSEE